MRVHVTGWNDETGDLVEVDYQCSASCMYETLRREGIHTAQIAGSAPHPEGGSVGFGGCPGGSETDYPVHCSACGVKLWCGTECLDGHVGTCDQWEAPEEEDTEPLTDTEARRIAAEWHGGMSSPLYSLASTGAIRESVFREIAEDIDQATTAFDRWELDRLYRYAEEHGPREPLTGWHLLHF